MNTIAAVCNASETVAIFSATATCAATYTAAPTITFENLLVIDHAIRTYYEDVDPVTVFFNVARKLLFLNIVATLFLRRGIIWVMCIIIGAGIVYNVQLMQMG